MRQYFKKIEIMQEKEEHIEKTDAQSVPTFEIGDLAVYPAHGVGRIEAIENRDVDGSIQSFYIMKILENDMVIMIPVQNVLSVGLRTLLSEVDIPKIYNIMLERDLPQDNQTWNRRYREYMEKIKTGSLYEVAGVFRDLYLLRANKELSFGERKLFDTAQCLLVKELSIARQCKEKTILDEINGLFEPVFKETEDTTETENQPAEDNTALSDSDTQHDKDSKSASASTKSKSNEQTG
jgi:CarD family transcriptional regulator